MTDKTKEVLKLALEALECKDGWGSSFRVLKERAVTSLRTALNASKIEGDLIQRFYEGEEAKSLISEAEETITALREALAEQPAQQQEPVAWMQNTTAGLYVIDHCDEWHCIPLYTSPPASKPWVGLTKTDVSILLTGSPEFAERFDELTPSWIELVKTIEAKLKEKNSD